MKCPISKSVVSPINRNVTDKREMKIFCNRLNRFSLYRFSKDASHSSIQKQWKKNTNHQQKKTPKPNRIKLLTFNRIRGRRLQKRLTV